MGNENMPSKIIRNEKVNDGKQKYVIGNNEERKYVMGNNGERKHAWEQ